MAPPRKFQALTSMEFEQGFRELWEPGTRDPATVEVLRNLSVPMSVVDELALVTKYPHLSPVLRRFASGSSDYDTEELHQAIQNAIVRGPRQPEIAQEDLDAEIEAALTNAAQGIPNPDLRDRVLELMHERDAYGIGWYPGMMPRIDLQLRSEAITAKPRKLSGVWPPPLPEPSVVDRLAAQVDPAAAERVAKMDKAIACGQEAVDDIRDLRALFDDVEEEEVATAEEAAARPVVPVADRSSPSRGLRARESRG